MTEVRMDRAFDRLSVWLAKRLGAPRTIIVVSAISIAAFCAGLVPSWAATVNPLGGAATGYIGILLLLVLQNGQNRAAAAEQAKLDELVRVNQKARNELIGAEELSEQQIAALRDKIRP